MYRPLKYESFFLHVPLPPKTWEPETGRGFVVSGKLIDTNWWVSMSESPGQPGKWVEEKLFDNFYLQFDKTEGQRCVYVMPARPIWARRL